MNNLISESRKLSSKRIALSVVFLCSIWTGCSKERQLTSATSPDRSYSLVITYSKPWYWIDSYAFLNVQRGTMSIVKEKLIYQGDFMDGDFDEHYRGTREWVNESSFRIGKQAIEDNVVLEVINSSQTDHKYVRLDGGDRGILFLFDVKKNSRSTTTFFMERELVVETDSLTDDNYYGKYFKVPKTNATSLNDNRFMIEITDDEILVRYGSEPLPVISCLVNRRRVACSSKEL